MSTRGLNVVHPELSGVPPELLRLDHFVVISCQMVKYYNYVQSQPSEHPATRLVTEHNNEYSIEYTPLVEVNQALLGLVV